MILSAWRVLWIIRISSSSILTGAEECFPCNDTEAGGNLHNYETVRQFYYCCFTPNQRAYMFMWLYTHESSLQAVTFLESR